MILDNSGIDYSGILLFVFDFLVYWNIEPNYRAFSCLRQHLVYDILTKRSRQSSQKNKIWCQRNQFLRFITINNISTPLLNWKIAVFSLVLLIITNVLLFVKIDWKILLNMILALKFFYTSNYSLVRPSPVNFLIFYFLRFLKALRFLWLHILLLYVKDNFSYPALILWWNFKMLS